MPSLRTLAHNANTRLRDFVTKALAGPPRKARKPNAAIYRRKDRLIVHSQSKTTSGLWIGCEPYIVLPVNASDRELGEAVLAALEQSREFVPNPQQSQWHEITAPLLEAGGAASWEDFSRKTVLVNARQSEQSILFDVWENLGVQNGFAPKQDCQISVRFGSADEIGAALRKALKLAR